MKITTPIATLIVDEETVIPLSLTNPMFEQQGSHSLPFSVPYNRHNLWALNLPFTPQKSTKSGQSIKATLEAYPLNETGEITVQTVTVDDRIELSFTTREGMFYAWANKTNLRELEYGVVEAPSGPGSVDTKLKNYLEINANQPYPLSKWAIFPVVLVGDREEIDTNPIAHDVAGYEYFRIMNTPKLANLPFSTASLKGGVRDFAPFLYVLYVMDIIFKEAGYLIEENELLKIEEIKRLCILNPVVSSVSNGSINLSELLPSMTVLEFIDSIINKFNAYLSFKPGIRSVSIRMRDEVLSQSANKNLHGDVLLVEFLHKILNITHDTINDDYIKPPNIPAEMAAERYDFIYTDFPSAHDPDAWNVEIPEDNPERRMSLFHVLSAQYSYYDDVYENPDAGSDYLLRRRAFGASSEQYTPEGDDIVRFHSKAGIHGMISTYVRYIYLYQHQPGSPGTAYANNAHLFCPTFQVGIVEMGSDIGDNLKEKEFPLCLSVYRGEYLPPWRRTYDIPYSLSDNDAPFGSCFVYDRIGKLLTESTHDVYPDTLSLQVMGEHGLRENFFKVTEEFYKHSGLKADVVHFNPAQVINHNMDEKVTIDGTECFLTQVNVEVSLNGLWVTGVQAITAKPLLD